MSQVGFEPVIPVFKKLKIMRALYCDQFKFHENPFIQSVMCHVCREQ
jgi:hypothetical protein